MKNDQPVALPRLRQDLAIEPAGSGASGEPIWLIHDRLQNRFFRISQQRMQFLQHWAPVFPEQMVALLKANCGITITKETLLEFAEFLFANSLTLLPPSADYRGLYARSLSGKKSWWQLLIHNYLFFRIPLARPQKMLDLTWPFVKQLFTRKAVVSYFIIALIGLYLVSRQWQVFLTTFASFLTLNGFLLYGLSLIVVKSLHELGHAFMAKRYNVEVPTIGVAFIVMTPILYTDTTAAWRLKNKKHRLMIDMAGIFTELVIAAIATLFWVFLPEGNLRAIAFTTATLSWVMSLTVNLNPFMKFDGYYILSDALGFENLQQRGFALAKWWLREKLFAISADCPENLSPFMHRLIIAHAIGVWIYRFFLFLGIAVLVYHFFFKLLGIFMFGVEMTWFIALPILNEIKQWWKMKDKIKASPRTKWTASFLMIALLAIAIPWSSTVTLPAILTQKLETKLFAPFAAQIEEVKVYPGMRVTAGDTLLTLGSPKLTLQIKDAKMRREIVRAKLSRVNADIKDRSQIQILSKEIASIDVELQGLKTKQAELVIRAPHDGLLVDVERNIQPGRWINETLQLAIIRSINQPVIKALAATKQRARLDVGVSGKFIPDNFRTRSFPVKLVQLSNITGAGSELAYLAESAGSLIPVIKGKKSRQRSKYAIFPLRLSAQNKIPSSDAIMRGVVVVDAKPESPLEKIIRQIASVLVREVGI